MPPGLSKIFFWASFQKTANFCHLSDWHFVVSELRLHCLDGGLLLFLIPLGQLSDLLTHLSWVGFFCLHPSHFPSIPDAEIRSRSFVFRLSINDV